MRDQASQRQKRSDTVVGRGQVNSLKCMQRDELQPFHQKDLREVARGLQLARNTPTHYDSKFLSFWKFKEL